MSETGNRENVRIAKLDAPIFGDGAWIKWKRLTYGERQKAFDEANQKREEGLPQFSEWLNQFVFDHLVDWSLDIPIPQTIEDLYALYDEEIEFLHRKATQATTGNLLVTADAIKN
jgi:hypothetical protein